MATSKPRHLCIVLRRSADGEDGLETRTKVPHVKEQHSSLSGIRNLSCVLALLSECTGLLTVKARLKDQDI
eukprot:3431488-Pleurochrysis_carterae.AAC.2